MMSVFHEFVNSPVFRKGLSSSWVGCCACSTKATTIKAPKSQQWHESPGAAKVQGQPTAHTHPHLLQNGEVMPGIRLEEFQERRHRFMSKIQKYALKHDYSEKQLVVIPSATKVYMTEKIPYVFRQNSDFLYLSGCMEPDSALILTGEGDSFKSTLFLRKNDSHSELWDGPRTDMDEAPSMFGVDQALPVGELPSYLFSFARSHRSFLLWYDYMQAIQPDIHKVLREFLTETWSKKWESPRPFIQQLRLYKSPAEVALMQATCKIGSDAISSTISSAHEGITEHQLFARVDYECRMRGAEYLAYPPVVAGGERANIIHYINNNQVVHRGDMVLMDAGCEYHGYCSDITRTWPISGSFTSTQKALYEAVLSVQKDLINLCSAFPTLDSLFNSMCKLLGKRLKELGMLSMHISENELSKAAYSFCPHHVSHYLGMDVHDTALIPRSINLEPGMVITVEPGIYVNPKNKLAAPEFRGMGVRIEDDVLLTASGPVVLTEGCPKEVADLENLCQS
ncbi:xaa-Pro aminopeptidase 3 [Anabrus simplex]|uniref:xaa-Pro aminopeptidase 3 n=1 Tax=Anabrus simplex TaxID=316456 RepID=UPI0035A2D3F2